MNDAIFSTSSNAADCLKDHYSAMQPCKVQQVGQSFAVPNTFKLSLIKAIATAYSVEGKCFVVNVWPNVYEVMRLEDGFKPELFYMSIGETEEKTKIEVVNKMPSYDEKKLKEIAASIKKEVELKNTFEIVKSVFGDYLNSSLLDCQKYEKDVTVEMKNASVIPLSYIQRRCAGLATFRKGGGNALIKSTVEGMIELQEVDKDFAKAAFKTSKKLYKVVYDAE